MLSISYQFFYDIYIDYIYAVPYSADSAGIFLISIRRQRLDPLNISKNTERSFLVSNQCSHQKTIQYGQVLLQVNAPVFQNRTLGITILRYVFPTGTFDANVIIF